MYKKLFRDSALFWVSVVVLLVVSSLFGFYGKIGAMTLSIVAGSLGIAFANLDKFSKIKGAGFEAEIREMVSRTKEKTEEVVSLVQPVIDKETEPEEPGKSTFRIEAYGTVGEEPRIVIKALGNSKYSRRTLDAIKKETKLDFEKVIKTLEWLEVNRLAVSSGAANKYWGLTYMGREVFRGLLEKNV